MDKNTNPAAASSPNDGSYVFDKIPLHWQMTRWEKFAFVALLDHAKPEVAIEIGTYRGGSLQMIAPRSGKVHSLDISASSAQELTRHFNNVEFHVGDSREILPGLLGQLDEQRAKLGFVLVDGDHTADGVKVDLEHLLDYQPRCDLYVVCHDSFNPECREGMLATDWSRSPHVHQVDIDFVPGVFHKQAFDTAKAGSMWGGFAVALMRPEKRDGELVIRQSQKGLFDQIRAVSSHAVSVTDSKTEGVAAKAKRLVARLSGSRLRKL